MNRKIVLPVLMLILISFIWTETGLAQPIPIPQVTVGVGEGDSPKDVATILQVIFLLTILTLAPAILIMTTSFTRIVIILSFARRALGTQQTPPNQIIVGLALFMTFFIMAPVWEQINDIALKPYFNGQIKAEVRTSEVNGREVRETVQPFYVMLEKGVQPLKDFMWRQLGERGAKEVALFLYMAQMEAPDSRDEVPMRIMIPAFVVSELQKAFIVGFVLFIPFLIIDMVVASVLMSMGMMMLPPVMISLPFKILLFVMVDGWHILIRSIGLSFLAGG